MYNTSTYELFFSPLDHLIRCQVRKSYKSIQTCGLKTNLIPTVLSLIFNQPLKLPSSIDHQHSAKPKTPDPSTHTFLHLDAFSLEQLAKLEDLFLELADELGVGVLVDDGLADDLLGAVGISVDVLGSYYIVTIDAKECYV